MTPEQEKRFDELVQRIRKEYEAYPYKSPELDAFIESLTPDTNQTDYGNSN